MQEPIKPAIGKLKAAGPLRDVMTAYFRELDEASQTGSSKVAWCTSVGPVELLRALGFLVYFPENHGAAIGASRLAVDLIPAANAIGYSPDVCSYLTSDIGSYLRKRTPLTKAYGMATVPRPDVLVYNTNQCRDVQDWLAFYQKQFDVPMAGIETPRSVGEISRAHLQGLIDQYKALVPVLEKVAGHALDVDRLREVVASSHRCTQNWKRVLRTATHRPSPFTFFDAAIHMGPAVVLRGDDRAVQYYDLLFAELEERIRGGVGAFGDETFRLYWDGMPVWGKLREHAELFAVHQACVVASTYCHSWVFDPLEHKDPFEGIASAYVELFIARSESHKERVLGEAIRDYGIDGMIYHDAKTCPNNSNNRYGMPGRLAKRWGIPYVVVQGDLNDLRLYSDEQATTQFEALLEQLRERARD